MLIAEARRCIKTPLDDPYTEKMEKKEDFLFGSQQLIRIYLEQMLIYMIRRNSSPPMTVPVSQFVNLKIIPLSISVSLLIWKTTSGKILHSAICAMTI